MMLVRDHGLADYTELLDMDATDVGVLTEGDRACLRELGEYLVTTDSWQRFAVWLLHKHFEPRDGEIFVERATPEPKGLETTLVERSTIRARDVSASAIRFEADRDTDVSIIAMEFAESVDFGTTSPLGADDGTVLAGIAERLRSYGKIERFGVKLIRNPLNLSERDLLIETCDTATRTMRCDVVALDDAPSELAFIETAWRWTLIKGGTQPEVMQECLAGCVAIGESHDLRHRHSGTDNDDNPIYPGPFTNEL